MEDMLLLSVYIFVHMHLFEIGIGCVVKLYRWLMSSQAVLHHIFLASLFDMSLWNSWNYYNSKWLIWWPTLILGIKNLNYQSSSKFIDFFSSIVIKSCRRDNIALARFSLRWRLLRQLIQSMPNLLLHSLKESEILKFDPTNIEREVNR